jgi:hypothetical protein
VNKKYIFRKTLAEQGIELTPLQANDLFEIASDLFIRSKKMSQLDILRMEELNVDGMTDKEKQDAISLYNHIRDLS